MTGKTNTDNQVFDFLNTSDLSNLLISNRQISGEVINYASTLRGEMQSIYDEDRTFEARFFERPDGPRVKLVATDDNSIRLQAKFMEDFWCSEPSPELLVKWLKKAPSKLLLRRYVGLEGNYPGAFLSGEHLINKISNLPVYRMHGDQDLNLEGNVEVLEALVGICEKHSWIRQNLYNALKTSTLKATVQHQIIQQRGDRNKRLALKTRAKAAMSNLGGSEDPDFEIDWEQALWRIARAANWRIRNPIAA